MVIAEGNVRRRILSSLKGGVPLNGDGLQVMERERLLSFNDRLRVPPERVAGRGSGPLQLAPWFSPGCCSILSNIEVLRLLIRNGATAHRLGQLRGQLRCKPLLSV